MADSQQSLQRTVEQFLLAEGWYEDEARKLSFRLRRIFGDLLERKRETDVSCLAFFDENLHLLNSQAAEEQLFSVFAGAIDLPAFVFDWKAQVVRSSPLLVYRPTNRDRVAAVHLTRGKSVQ